MTGIDLPISNLTTLFTSKLWTGKTNDFNGRIYDNEREDGINPELYISGKQYKEKLLNNNVDSTVFFRVKDYDPTELLADVSIYFSVNLATLYPTITTERADAYAIRDAKKWVDWSEFRIIPNGIIPGKPAFADYFGAEQNKHDMQPYFLFRIDTEVSYSIDACEVVAPTTFNLTLSSGANGTSTSSVGEEGVIVVNSGTNVAAYADPDPGYRFSQWLRNTIPISLNPYAFIMNQDITLTAEFIVSIIKQLQIAVSGTGTTSPAPGVYDKEQGSTQLITATETDVNYYFDHWSQDGIDYLTNPNLFTINDNSVVSAYFKLQHVFVAETIARKENYDYSSVYTGTVRTVGSGGGFTTITAAFNASSSYDIIEILDGTYDMALEPPGYLLLNSKKNILIRGNSSYNTLVTLTSANPSFCIRLRDCGEVVFKDLTITYNENQYNIYQDGQYTVRSLICDNIIFNKTIATSGIYTMPSASDSAIRYCEFKNCTFDSNGSFLNMENQGVNGTFLITGCAYDAENIAIACTATSECSIYAYDNTINQNSNSYSILLGNDITLPTKTLGQIELRSNTINRAATFYGHDILLGRGTKNVYCVNNIINGSAVEDSLNLGIVIKTTADILGDSIIEGNYIDNYRPIYIKGGRNNIVNYNSGISNADFEPLGIVNYINGADEELSTGNEIKYNNLVGGDYGIRLYDVVTSQRIVAVAKTCDIDYNRYYFTVNYLFDGENIIDIVFADRAAFWGNNNDLNSILLTAAELPIKLE